MHKGSSFFFFRCSPGTPPTCNRWKPAAPCVQLEHNEVVIAVGRGFDWLHLPNKALIIGPFDHSWTTTHTLVVINALEKNYILIAAQWASVSGANKANMELPYSIVYTLDQWCRDHGIALASETAEALKNHPPHSANPASNPVELAALATTVPHDSTQLTSQLDGFAPIHDNLHRAGNHARAGQKRQRENEPPPPSPAICHLSVATASNLGSISSGAGRQPTMAAGDCPQTSESLLKYNQAGGLPFNAPCPNCHHPVMDHDVDSVKAAKVAVHHAHARCFRVSTTLMGVGFYVGMRAEIFRRAAHGVAAYDPDRKSKTDIATECGAPSLGCLSPSFTRWDKIGVAEESLADMKPFHKSRILTISLIFKTETEAYKFIAGVDGFVSGKDIRQLRTWHVDGIDLPPLLNIVMVNHYRHTENDLPPQENSHSEGPAASVANFELQHYQRVTKRGSVNPQNMHLIPNEVCVADPAQYGEYDAMDYNKLAGATEFHQLFDGLGGYVRTPNVPTVVIRLAQPTAPMFGAVPSAAGRFDIELECEGMTVEDQPFVKDKVDFRRVTADNRQLPVVVISVVEVDKFAFCLMWRSKKVEATWKLVRAGQWPGGNAKWFEQKVDGT